MKIAFCFLTYKNIIHRSLWDPYFENNNVYIHPKQREFIDEADKRYVIPNIINTSWGEKSIVDATILLLEQAKEDMSNQWFILCSEDSCPLKKYEEFRRFMESQTLSIFNVMDSKKNKTSQWWALCRADVELLLKNKSSFQSIFDNLTNRYRKQAVDELFFLTALKQFKPNYTFRNGCVHYVKWFTEWVSKHPTSFNRLMEEDKQNINNHSCWFIRKTFPTFEPKLLDKKQNCIIMCIGSKSSGNYQPFMNYFCGKANIFLLVMDPSKLAEQPLLKERCEQAFYVVWNMADKAMDVLYNKFTSIYSSSTVYLLTETYNYSGVSYPPEREEDWSKQFSKTHQQYYWFNSKTGERSWTPPVTEDIHNASQNLDFLKKVDGIYNLSNSNIAPTLEQPIATTSIDAHTQLTTIPEINELKETTELNKTAPEEITLKEYNRTYKVAFLFLVIEDIHYPDIWGEYFSGHEQKISIYCHAKYPDKVTTEWLRRNIITNIRPTSWGHIVDAYFSLFDVAIQDKDNMRFIPISESCLPIYSFDKLLRKLSVEDYRTSLVHFMRPSKYDISARISTQPGYQRFGEFTKHYARFCLSRYHIDKLLRCSPADIDFFKNMHVGDEFFLTLIHARNGVDFMEQDTITYDNWEDVNIEVNNIKTTINQIKSDNKRLNGKDYEGPNLEVERLYKIMDDIRKNPKTYYSVTPYDIERAFRSGAYFWRKFPPGNPEINRYYRSDGSLINPRDNHNDNSHNTKLKKTKRYGGKVRKTKGASKTIRSKKRQPKGKRKTIKRRRGKK